MCCNYTHYVCRSDIWCLQVFGGLLTQRPEEEVDSGEGEKEDEVREHMMDILFTKNKLSSLQKQVSWQQEVEWALYRITY